MSAKRKAPIRAGIGAHQNSAILSHQPADHTAPVRELQARILERRHLLPPATARLVAELAFAEAAR